MASNFSQDVVPIGIGYLVLMAVLAAGLRLDRRDARAAGQHATTDPEVGPGGKRPGMIGRRFPPGWPRFAAQVCSVMIGGYLLLMAVDISYYYGVARVAGQFLASAVTGGLLLIGICLPVFAAASWAAERRRHRVMAEDQPPD